MQVTISRLQNGFTVATHEMPYLESVALGIWVKSGARDETIAQHGIAHLFEHMAFKGTKERTAYELSATVEGVGGEINAATSIETTGFFARVLAKDSDLAVDILSSILKDPLFAQEELEKEKQVVLQEIGATYDAPEDIVFDYFTETAFRGQIVGRPILGTVDTVRSFTQKDLRDFMSSQYSAENMVLVAAGAIDHDKVLKAAEKYLSDFPTGNHKTPAKKARYTGGDFREKRNLLETQLLIGFPGKAFKTKDYYTSQLLAIILGGGMSSRLFQEIREKRGLCYSIYAFHWGFIDIGLFGIQASTRGESLPELVELITRELRRASRKIDKQDIKRAQAQYQANLTMTYESPTNRAHTFARQILLCGRVLPIQEIYDQICSITEKQLVALAEEIFLDQEPTIAAVGDIDKLSPYEEIRKALTSK